MENKRGGFIWNAPLNRTIVELKCDFNVAAAAAKFYTLNRTIVELK